MSEPEIARRCQSCGASIRDSALFCPQCGVELPQQKFEQTSPLMAPTLEDTIAESAPIKQPSPLMAPTLEDTIAESASSVANKPVEPPRVETPKEPTPNTNETRGALVSGASRVEPAKASTGKSARGAVGAGLQRATSLARDVEGDVMHRARRVREISSVVLDEAAYDPSLRFVLVAALLFVLFLMIFLLNKFIT